MFSKTTPPASRRGFTLPEVLITMAIASITMAALASLALYTGRSFASLANYVDLDNRSRTALDILTRDIRQVNNVEYFNSNKVVFIDGDGAELTFEYSPTTRTLTRIKGQDRKVLLTECDELEFRMFQRNTTPGTFDLVPSSDVLEGKAIDISWVCSRKLLGVRFNTESVQTARVIIRKQQATRY
ncbi:prepilin-type N-terminal cleavage/methylation domain-containing protein [Fontisphaera persica]|uniref:PilW family protein n=1 Tax=Fontisphaera persica TaxID=2974023 RepID=UPI0024C033C4|nr:prepilin-type N-terminal cleavage/methylation domain-containing protein [Fontisphaera persica]WCJ59162.1 prepilin-type N-terminal cleavage/methylation domain-containing protein [Fontisphaera persica]